jgi:hypothetical protein
MWEPWQINSLLLGIHNIATAAGYLTCAIVWLMIVQLFKKAL